MAVRKDSVLKLQPEPLALQKVSVDGILFHLKVTARKRPHPFERRDSPFVQQNLQVLSIVSEDDAGVDRPPMGSYSARTRDARSGRA